MSAKIAHNGNMSLGRQEMAQKKPETNAYETAHNYRGIVLIS